MKIDGIPQDNSASYHGHRRVVYGTHDGHYGAATSSGWQDGTYAIKMVVRELDAQAQAAREAIKKSGYFPLYYHMFHYRYDETGLAMATGVWKWQPRQHFRPEVFAKLPAKTLQKYADACRTNIDGFKQTDI